jgi:hypothetical protein
VKTFAALCAAGLAALSASSAQADDAEYDRPEPAMQARDWRDVIGRFELGYRGVFVTNAGYNPFSTQDYFSGIALALSHTLFARSRVSFAVGAAWDYGSSGATSRGDLASLAVHRVTVPLEGRVHFGAWGYAFLRVAPGAAHERAELDEASAPTALTSAQWLFATDASVGYAIPVIPLPERPGRSARIWLQSDLGYSWVADDRLSLQSVSGAGTDTVDLRTSLGLRGAFFHVAAAVSY